MRKTVRGAPITILGMAAREIAGSQPLRNAWLLCAGLVGTVDPVRIHPRQGHRVDARGAKRLRLLHVCFWHKADITTALNDVRYWG